MSEIEMSLTSLYTPSKRGISIRSGARKNILNVYSRLREENPELKEKIASIYYLDETWVNEGHSETRVRQDTTIKSSYEASSSNLTVGLTAPKGKGRRFIITHIGSKEGFVRDVADIFIGEKSRDYHEEMDGNHFEKWFETVMSKLKSQSFIVMDNAPYHSVKKRQNSNKFLGGKCNSRVVDRKESEMESRFNKN
ncbi:DDE_3 domain-containing protein [Trichonephila clavipes]|nr:DDE_3 domain-containing protein [Trichonephila clavipes]